MDKTDPATPLPDGMLHLQDLEALRLFVKNTLCEYEQLDSEQLSMSETRLIRTGKSCGLTFRVHGHRSTRSSVVWSADDKQILFYNSSGKRYLSYRLSEESLQLNGDVLD